MSIVRDNLDNIISGLTGDTKSPEVSPPLSRTPYDNPNRKLIANAPEVSTELLNGIYDSVSATAEDVSDIAILLNTAHEHSRIKHLQLTSYLLIMNDNLAVIRHTLLTQLKEQLRTDLLELENQNEASRVVRGGIPQSNTNTTMDPNAFVGGSGGSGGNPVVAGAAGGLMASLGGGLLALVGKSLAMAGVVYGAYSLGKWLSETYVVPFLESTIWPLFDNIGEKLSILGNAIVDQVKAVASFISTAATDAANYLADSSLSLKVADATGISAVVNTLMGGNLDGSHTLPSTGVKTTHQYREKQEQINKNAGLKPGMVGFIDPMTLPTHEEFLRPSVTVITTPVIPHPTRNMDINSVEMERINQENKETASNVVVVTGNDMSSNNTNVMPGGSSGPHSMPPSIPLRSARNTTPVMRYMEWETMSGIV